MFKRKDNRYITKGIELGLPENLKRFCWSIIDGLVAKGDVKLDYFQMFEFETVDER